MRAHLLTPPAIIAGPPELPLHGSARGIVNLGGGPTARANDPVFERFQQIDLQWADIEPEEGVYNWTLPETLALSINASGRMAVYKINANVKPDWLYEKVPYANITWNPEQMDGKTAMYWHPAYVAALERRIAAQAEWLATSPHGHLYSYVRQTWAAIGEEGLGIPTGKGASVAALRDGKNWIVPSGCAPKSACDPPPSYDAGSNSSFTSPTDVAYLAAIGDAWLAGFNRTATPEWHGVLLLRANGYDTRWVNISAEMMASGGFGWFHTGAGMTATQCFNQTFRYAPFRRDCLHEHGVVCFAESCGMSNFAGPGPKKTAALKAANFSRIQGAYWELLSDMASGIHVSGVHSSTFLNPFMAQRNFAEMYAWCDAYIGLHASPWFAPGAWIAFRPDMYEGMTPATAIGDYSFLMQRLNATQGGDTSVGQVKCGTSWEEGNASTPWGAWCRSLPAGGSISLALDPVLAQTFVRGATNGTATVRLVYSDDSAAAAAVALASPSAPSAALPRHASLATPKPHIVVRFDDGTASGAVAIDTAHPQHATAGFAAAAATSWRDVRVNVTGAAFARGGPNSADVWVTNAGGGDVLIHMVEVAH